MRIANAFIAIAVVSLFLGTLAILPLTKQSLNWSVERLSEVQKENLRQIIENSFEDKRVYLANLSKVIQSDANLSGALVLAEASRDYSVYNEQIEDFRHRSNLEFFEMLPKNKLVSKNPVVSACLKEFDGKLTGEALCQDDEHVLVASVAPLYLYGDAVGIVFMASNLVGVKPGVRGTLNVDGKSLFRMVRSNQRLSDEVYRLGDSAVVADLKPNVESISAVNRTLQKIIALGSIVALLFMLLFIGLAVRYFFLYPFETIIADLARASTSVEIKNTFEFREPRFLLWENRQLLLGLKTFVAQITLYERRLIETNTKLVESEKSAAIGRLSRQVAHDIRSPLTALQLVLKEAHNYPEANRELLVAAVKRITNIANDLLSNYRKEVRPNAASAVKSTLVLETRLDENIRLCLREKAPLAASKNVQIDYHRDDGIGEVVVALQETQLQNVISNLLTNAIEASKQNGKIVLALSKKGSLTEILIRDFGHGMPEEVLKKAGVEEMTFGKEGGNGLGLFSARQRIESIGGEFKIRSEVNEGTEITMRIPWREVVEEYRSHISIQQGASIIIVDDDKAIHEVWRHRLAELAASQTVFISNIMTAEQFRIWYSDRSKNGHEIFQFFVDYDFQDPRTNGLELIAEFGIASRSTLVTAHFAEPEVLSRSRELNVKILPKNRLADAPFLVE